MRQKCAKLASDPSLRWTARIVHGEFGEPFSDGGLQQQTFWPTEVMVIT